MERGTLLNLCDCKINQKSHTKYSPHKKFGMVINLNYKYLLAEKLKNDRLILVMDLCIQLCILITLNIIGHNKYYNTSRRRIIL